MTDKTTKKTVSKASASKQVKAAAGPAKAAETAKTAAKPAKPTAKAAEVLVPGKLESQPAASAAVAQRQPETKPAPNAAMNLTPSWEDVARKAYELYELDGASHGRDQDHWFQAEQELRKRTLA